MHEKDKFMSCYITYMEYLFNKGNSLNLLPILKPFISQLTDSKFPSILIDHMLVDINNSLKFSDKQRASVSRFSFDETILQQYFKGRAIWLMFLNGKAFIRNVVYALWTKANNRFGDNNPLDILWNIRISLDLFDKRRIAENKYARDARDNKKKNVVSVDNKSYRANQMKLFHAPKMAKDWFPSSWIVFNLLGYPNETNSFASYISEAVQAKATLVEDMKSIRSTMSKTLGVNLIIFSLLLSKYSR